MTSARAVFCDFDGTITQTETFVDMLRTYAPDLASQIIPQIHTFEVSLFDGVTRMLESIPSPSYAAAIAHADAVPLRPGFEALVDACAAHGVPFIVVSGGLRDMVRRRLGAIASKVTAIYGVDVDTTGPTWRVVSPWANGEELVSKVRVMQAHPAAERVAIGDSTTDVRMSEVAERVFARDRLADYLDKHAIAYTPWQDFHDIYRALATPWSWPATGSRA
jgi:2-hydroxy-3-keto-5-methylthiopentenyl-1-phosphate phosphatase